MHYYPCICSCTGIKKPIEFGENIPAWDTDLMKQPCTTHWPQKNSGYCKGERHVAVWGTQVSLQPRPHCCCCNPTFPRGAQPIWAPYTPVQGLHQQTTQARCGTLPETPWLVFSLSWYLFPLHIGDILTQKENLGQDFLRNINCLWICLKGKDPGP